MNNNIVRHHASVTRTRREQMQGHRSLVLWFTGLSGSGKSTLAHAVEERLFQPGEFIEIHCNCPLEVCEQRDVKGMYRRARAGEIPDFTGISAPYEAPENPELVVHTAEQSLEQCVEQVMALLAGRLPA